MRVGPTCPMEDIRIWGGPTIPQSILQVILQVYLQHLQYTTNQSNNNPTTGITARIRKDTTHTLETVRVVG